MLNKKTDNDGDISKQRMEVQEKQEDDIIQFFPILYFDYCIAPEITSKLQLIKRVGHIEIYALDEETILARHRYIEKFDDVKIIRSFIDQITNIVSAVPASTMKTIIKKNVLEIASSTRISSSHSYSLWRKTLAKKQRHVKNAKKYSKWCFVSFFKELST